MTALERAKAFVNTRAAKTALKIMPLALATVVAVGHPQKAQAGVLTLSGGSAAAWINGGISGGAKLGQPGLNLPTPFTPDVYPPSSSPNATGSEANSNAGGSYIVGTAAKPFDLGFYISGNGTFGETDLSNPAYVEAKFNMACETSQGSGVPCTGESYTYTLTAFFDQHSADMSADDSKWGYTATVTGSFVPNGSTGYDVFLPISDIKGLGCQWTVDMCPDDLTNFQAQIDFGWTGSANEYATFPTDLIINAGNAPVQPPAMPEPSSMLLALSGLPLIGRLIRRKK